MSGIDPELARELMADDPFGLLDVKPKAAPATIEERLLASFNEITEFVREHGREPSKQTTDIKERRLAVRLEAMAGTPEQYEALREFDELDILKPPAPPETIEEALDSDPFGLLDGGSSDDAGTDTADIFALRNVPEATRDVNPADEVAQRQRCENFAAFEPLFQAVHADLRSGRRTLRKFERNSRIDADRFLVFNGIVCYVAEVGEVTRDDAGRPNARLHVVFENGTESRMLLQSLQVALRKGNGKRITEPNDETLERMGLAPGTRMGSVYVLRSQSNDPQLAPYPNLHKIGHTTQAVEKRVAQAVKDATFLGAPVEIVAEYELPAVGAPKVEAMLHRFFAVARLDIWFERDGAAVVDAKEWFDVPLALIDEAIGLIQAEAIDQFEYDRDARTIRIAMA